MGRALELSAIVDEPVSESLRRFLTYAAEDMLFSIDMALELWRFRFCLDRRVEL